MKSNIFFGKMLRMICGVQQFEIEVSKITTECKFLEHDHASFWFLRNEIFAICFNLIISLQRIWNYDYVFSSNDSISTYCQIPTCKRDLVWLIKVIYSETLVLVHCILNKSAQITFEKFVFNKKWIYVR